MSSRTVMLLAVGVVVLFAAMFALDYGGRDQLSDDTGPLLPDLKRHLNDVDAVTVTSTDGTITIRNENGRWIVPEKSGYPADTGKLRTLLLALADARRIEQKTSNPDMYEHLGVEDPAQEGSGGVLVSVTAGGEERAGFAAILGDPAQGDYRYARRPDEAQSWLIDRNPQVPGHVGGWLLPTIVDIPSTRIRAAELRHADGETIRTVKESPEDGNFQVEDVPEDRELSYPSVANGIAGVLGNLTLDDVREASNGQELATVSFTTFDGLGIDVAVYDGSDSGDDESGDDGAATWIALEASARGSLEKEPQAAQSGSGTGEETAAADPGGTEPAGSANAAGDEITAEVAEAAPEASEPATSPQDEADAINERVAGWQYRIPDHKARQLTRRWDDLLAE